MNSRWPQPSWRSWENPENPQEGAENHFTTQKKITATILLKEARRMSFEGLAAELKNQGCDLRTEEAKKKVGEKASPCPSQLHWAMTKIPEEYLKKGTGTPGSDGSGGT
jgi:hypothetical protein